MEAAHSLTLPGAVGISLVGFGIVFFVLVALMAVIRCLHTLVDSMNATKAAAAPAAPVAAVVPSAPARDPNMVPAVGSLGEVKLHNVDDTTAAMLMAIVADELKAPLNELRFLSIREKK